MDINIRGALNNHCFGCYESVECNYCTDCSRCIRCSYLRDCHNCTDCVFCSNVINGNGLREIWFPEPTDCEGLTQEQAEALMNEKKGLKPIIKKRAARGSMTDAERLEKAAARKRNWYLRNKEKAAASAKAYLERKKEKLKTEKSNG